MNHLKKNSGSFRDPAGEVYHYNDRIIRIIKQKGKSRYEYIKKNNLIKESVEKNFLIESKEIENKFDNFSSGENCYFIEHEKIDYISYPYEWSFFQLKAAALHHLNYQIFLLEKNAVLIDATAYNIQFKNNKPIFIDLLSLDKYNEGDYWIGYNQFLQEYLNPLLMQSLKGITFNNWYKGNLNGIYTEDLNKILSIKDKISLKIYMHVVLLEKFLRKTTSDPNIIIKKFKKKKNLSKNSYKSILIQLKKWIENLEPAKRKSVWENYSIENTYEKNQKEKKLKILQEFINKLKPNKIIDLGCNDGYYSIESLKLDCKSAVGVDFDPNAINQAYKNSKSIEKSFLPLYMDFMNPSSNLGWNEKERYSFLERANFDCVIAFAFEHHLSIANNVPLEQTINWILKIAKKGLIEFVSKEDFTIQNMLSVKGDIFPDYNKENFEYIINKKANIIKVNEITNTRVIYEFEVK